MNEELLTMILIGVAIILLIALIFAAVEIIRTVRKVRGTVDELMPSVGDTVSKVNTAIATLEPSLKRVDPLLERVSLTVDAVNLEIMRADQILADVSDVTSVASGTAKKVSGITEAPLNLLTSATDKIRSVFVDKKAEKRVERVLERAEDSETATSGGATAANAVSGEGRGADVADANGVDGANATVSAVDIAGAVGVADAAFARAHGAGVSDIDSIDVEELDEPADDGSAFATPVVDSFARSDQVLEQVAQNIKQQVAQTAQTAQTAEVPTVASLSDHTPASGLVPELAFSSQTDVGSAGSSNSDVDADISHSSESTSKQVPRQEPVRVSWQMTDFTGRSRSNPTPPPSAASSPPPPLPHSNRAVRGRRRTANAYATESSTIFFN
jgi:uncharacterized protein YoxC